MIDIISKLIAIIITFFLFANIATLSGRIIVNGSIVQYIKDDWMFRLPERWNNNRHTGLNKIAYNILCVFYYVLKEIIVVFFVLMMMVYKFFLWDVWNKLLNFDKYEWYRKEKSNGLLSPITYNKFRKLKKA